MERGINTRCLHLEETEGKTDNYITVHAPSDIDLNDQFRNVLLERNENGIVIGKIVE